MQRNGNDVLHGHEAADVAQSPFQHLTGVAAAHLLVQLCTSLTHMFRLAQRMGDEAGHGHFDSESAQLRSQHATCDDEQLAVQLRPRGTHDPSSQRSVPGRHEQSERELTHLESQHWNCAEEHERQ